MAYSKTKKIKAVTFDVLNEMSEYLFRHQNGKPYQEIQKKVANFLTDNGEKKFVEIYNDTQETKDYIKALDTFKI
jgi:heterodisulfide reductase subunit C